MMMFLKSVPFLGLCILVMDIAVASHDVPQRPNVQQDGVLAVLINRIDDMQIKLDRLVTSEKDLKQTMAELVTQRESDKQATQLLINNMQSKLDRLKTSENALKRIIALLVKEDDQQEDEIALLRNKIDRLDTSEITKKERIAEPEETFDGNITNAEEKDIGDVPEHTRSSRETKSNEVELSVPTRKVRKSTRRSPQHVAFTVYLDHVHMNLGSLQIVVFNRIEFNQGNGYSAYSGIFHVPTAGVYLFSWSVTASKVPSQLGYDARVRLIINGNHKVGAVAESRSNNDDNQGSNAAVYPCSQGDEVWIQHYDGTDLYGDEVVRSTSFTGVLLYI